MFGQIISKLLVDFKDGVLLQLYERHPAFLAVVPLLALLFYAGAYLTISFQQGMAALREEQAAYFMERQQTQAIRARIHEAEQFVMKTTFATGHDKAARLLAGKIKSAICQADTVGISGVQPRAFSLFK